MTDTKDRTRATAPPRIITSGYRVPPIPKGGRPKLYHIDVMRPGDSFFIAEAPGTEAKAVRGPLMAAKAAVRRQANSMPGATFAFRREGKGWRCYRET